MYKKLIVLAAVVCAVIGQASRYPAGLNPNLCPNFPHCDNALLAAYNPPAGLAPSYAAPPAAAPYAAAPGYGHGAPAAAYPAGVSPASCPNYPYCSNSVAAAAPPLPGFTQREYPAGISPSVCPNYPYC